MYKKYTYWLTEQDFFQAKARLESEGVSPKETRKAVCLPLSPKIPVGYVPPDAWTRFDLCRRQLSWYAVSEFAGLYLLVSETPLTTFGLDFSPETFIEKSKFKPKRLPKKDPDAIQKLADNQAFRARCPAEFIDIASVEKSTQSRWLKTMGIRGTTYEELLVEHCANHANFIAPEYFSENGSATDPKMEPRKNREQETISLEATARSEGNDRHEGSGSNMETENRKQEKPKPGIRNIAPYSIAKTARVCSACLQFFNIIGRQFREKYVVPCPGASLFAGMAVNKYYRVLTRPDQGPS